MSRQAGKISAEEYRRSNMQKEAIIKALKERGCRITKQRQLLLDIILSDEYSCCKEIYYKASQRDENIGTATVYRMVKTLEDIGAIVRNSMYKLNCPEPEPEPEPDVIDQNCRVKLDDNTCLALSAEEWKRVVEMGLFVCGYMMDHEVTSVQLGEEEEEEEEEEEKIGA